MAARILVSLLSAPDGLSKRGVELATGVNNHTVKKRVGELEDVGLIEVTEVRQAHVIAHVLLLTPRGRAVATHLDHASRIAQGECGYDAVIDATAAAALKPPAPDVGAPLGDDTA